MTTILLKCRICDNWYRPAAHSYHCPVCGSTPILVSRNRVKCFHLLTNKAIEVVRGIPKYTAKNLNAMASVLASDKE